MHDPSDNDTLGGPETVMSDSPARARGVYIARLFRGDIPLVTTYWLWGVLGNGVFSGLSLVIEANYASVVTSWGGVFLVRYFYWVALAFAVFTWIAIWRSAGKYTGQGWDVAARVMVLIAVLANVYWLTAASDDDYSLQAEVRMMNQSLPVMLDDYTRLDSVAYETTRLSYYHTIVGAPASEIDADFLRQFVRGNVIETVCNDHASIEILENGIDYRYAYTDEAGKFITELTVTISDCP